MPVLPPIIVRPHVFVAPALPELQPNYEVAEAFWVPIRCLFDPARTRDTTVETRGLRMRVSAIDVDGRIIWGMTERILRNFESVLGR